MLQGPKSTIRQSRRLRKDMSLPEVLLWQALRTRPGGFKFRRSHPAGEYSTDFFCHKARLVIEVDGECHERGNRPQRDEARDQWFADLSFITFRVPAREVLTNLDGVISGIVHQAEQGQ